MVMRYLGGINSPSYNPLAANVTTGFTTVQQGGVYTATSVVPAIPAQQWVDDEYFSQTVLLLQANNSPDGAQNGGFIDSSTTNNIISRTGSPTQGSFSPFTSTVTQYNRIPNANSVMFPGLGNYVVTTAGGAPFPSNATTFTVECWMYMTVIPPTVNPCIVGDMSPTGTANNWSFGPTSASKLAFYWFSSPTVFSATGNTTLSINTWYHIAVSVNANAISLYVNGTRETITGTSTLTNRTSSTSSICLGQTQSSVYYYRGYVSNVSILSGVAKYSGATITVPTEPLPTFAEGQVFLFANQGAVDSNTAQTSKPMTLTGGIGNNYISPFATTTPGALPANGGSMYFDSTAGYLDIGGSPDVAFGTNDFTIEFFVRINVLATGMSFYDARPTSTNGAYATIYKATDNTIRYYANTADRITGPALAVNTWYHIVVSRVSGTTRMFVNGSVQATTYTDSTTYLNGASRPRIGAYGTDATFDAEGYISNLRVLNGTGVTSVTVPTAPLTDITNTRLLLSGTNANIYDATVKSPLQTAGNSRISTQLKKYGSGSMYFDGTGDWLVIPDSVDLRLGTGDFTVEAWVNVTTYATPRSIIGKGTTTTGWFFYIATTGKLAFGYSTLTLNGNNQLDAGQWYHIALVRYGNGIGNVRMYINGNLDIASTSAITVDFNQTNVMYVGADRTTGNPYLGYIDELRVTKGLARYTTSFIPPTTAFPRMG
jgi:hypothetical protein